MSLLKRMFGGRHVLNAEFYSLPGMEVGLRLRPQAGGSEETFVVAMMTVPALFYGSLMFGLHGADHYRRELILILKDRCIPALDRRDRSLLKVRGQGAANIGYASPAFTFEYWLDPRGFPNLGGGAIVRAGDEPFRLHCFEGLVELFLKIHDLQETTRLSRLLSGMQAYYDSTGDLGGMNSWRAALHRGMQSIVQP